MLRCFVLIIVLPIFCRSALAAEPAAVPLAMPLAAPIEPPNAAPLAVAPVNPEIQHAPPQQWIGIIQTPYRPMMMQLAPPPPYRDYQMNRIIKPKEKKRWLQMPMPMPMPMMANMMQLDAREAMNLFVIKHDEAARQSAQPETGWQQPAVERFQGRAE